MKVGDLVEPRWPDVYTFGKVYLVTEWRINWIKVLGQDRWMRITDFEVVNASR